MKKRITNILGAGVVVAGLLAAQTPQPAPDQQTPQSRMARRGPRGHAMVMGRLANHLGLTEDQKTQARTIFQQSAEAAKPIHDRMRDAQKALAEAAKANAPVAEIDRLSQDVGALAGQLAASRTKAFAQFYSILTQEQKDKLESVQDRFMNGGIGPGAFGKRGWGQARQGRS